MSRRYAWLLALCAVLTNLVSFLDRQTLSVLAPSVRHGLDIDQPTYGWLNSAFACAYLAGGPLAGWLLDRFGARRGLVVSVLLWSVVSASHSLAPTFGVLLAMRIALGLAESPALPGTTQVITRVLPPGDRSRGLGLLWIGSSAGAAIAAPLATTFASAWGWRSAFLGTAAAGLIWLPIWLAIAWRGTARQALDRPAERTTRAAPPVLETLSKPIIIRAVIAVFVSSPVVLFSSVWSAEMLVTDHGLPNNAVGHYLWLPPLGIDVGSLLFGDLFSRRAARRTGETDRLLFAIACMFVIAGTWIAAFATSPWMAVSGTSTMMFGMAGVYTLILAEATARVEGATSLMGGFFVASQSLAFIIGNPIIGYVGKHTNTYSGVLFVLGLFGVLSAAVWLAPGRAPPPRT